MPWQDPTCRNNSALQVGCFCCSITVTFVSEKDGSETTVQAPIGQHLLEVAHKNDIELEGMCLGPPSRYSQAVLRLNFAANTPSSICRRVMPSYRQPCIVSGWGAVA
jgi:hypothetical protein